MQQSFRRAAGAEPGRTQRNLFGQLDGTANPKPGGPLETAVWRPDGSTTLVVRRVSMNLETWDLLGRTDRELAIGQRLDTGAPLTGTANTTNPTSPNSARMGSPSSPTTPTSPADTSPTTG